MKTIIALPKFVLFAVVFSVIAFSMHLTLGWLASYNSYYTDALSQDSPLPPFPLGVVPSQKLITEQPGLDTYISQYISSNHTGPLRTHSWSMLVRARLEQFSWYQQLATPSRRVAVIWSGQRQEQIAAEFKKLFGWSDEETERFIQQVNSVVPDLEDGTYYPGRYIFDLPVSPDIASFTINQRFSSEVLLRYSSEISSEISLADTLTIASLIEREAYNFDDMRIISGVIWNRLFIDMPLQLDATLQYVRGTAGNNRSWWPIPRPADKFIDSSYNTYQNNGLPPGPIANPSLDAIIATLNPKATDCLFYFHADDGSFFCTPTYEEHVALLKSIFGQGR